MRRTRIDSGSPLAVGTNRGNIAPRALVPDDVLVSPRPLRTQHHPSCPAMHRHRLPGTTRTTRCTTSAAPTSSAATRRALAIVSPRRHRPCHRCVPFAPSRARKSQPSSFVQPAPLFASHARILNVRPNAKFSSQNTAFPDSPRLRPPFANPHPLSHAIFAVVPSFSPSLRRSPFHTHALTRRPCIALLICLRSHPSHTST